MKNRNGFTLIEMIAVVIILGLIILIAVPIFTGSLNVFRDDYYTSLKSNVKNAGNEFFNDNKIYLPHSLLDASIIKLSDLVDNKYIDDVKDYTGKSCDLKSSYVIVIRKGKDKYEYSTCLKCSEDDYDTTEGNTACSNAWIDGFKMTKLGRIETVHVYIGTSKANLKEKVVAYPSVFRCASNDPTCAHPIDQILTSEEDEAEPIYPISLDTVNTNVVGTYDVKYRFQNGPEETGHVVVFESASPIVSFTQTEIYHNETIEGNTSIDEQIPYDPTSTDDWAQRLFTTFTMKFNSSQAGSDTKVARYQRFMNNRWEDYCTNIESDINNTCVVEELKEMNENVKFRYIDNHGNISGETDYYNMRVDKTKPSCSLKLSGTKGSDDWYTTKVEVKFASNIDTDRDGPFPGANSAKSGLKRSVITTSKLNNNNHVQNDDTKNVKWYGFVEDKARNWITCEIEFKQDVSSQTCSITGHASLKGEDKISQIIKADFRKNDSTVLINNVAVNPKLDTWTDSKTVTVNGDWTLTTTNSAGTTCTKTSKYCEITYSGNGGSTPTKTKDIKRETEKADLTPTSRKAAYKMIGWNTDANATTALSEYVVQKEDTRTLYAIYTKCGKGQYTNDVGTSCLSCPTGYQDGEPVGSKTECIKSVPCGEYVEKANDATTKKCGDTQYRNAHTLKYGETSKCEDVSKNYYKKPNKCEQEQCPEGYRDANVAASSVSGCKMTVPKGKFIKTANDSSPTKCPKNTYNSSTPSVSYGSTSKCTNCPDGQVTDSTGSTSSSSCHSSCANPKWTCEQSFIFRCSGDFHGTRSDAEKRSADGFSEGDSFTFWTDNNYIRCTNKAGQCSTSYLWTCDACDSKGKRCAQGTCTLSC